MKVLNTSMIKLTLCFIAGVILSTNFRIPLNILIGVISIFSGIVMVFYFIARKHWIQNIFFGLTTFLFLTALGTLTFSLHQPENNKKHYTHVVSENQVYDVKGQVLEILKSYGKYDNYIIATNQVDSTQVNGKLLLKVTRDSLTETLEVDDHIAINNKLLSIPRPLNPHQFDYSQYMARQNVLLQANVDSAEIFILFSETSSLRGYAHASRKHIELQLRKSGFEDEELSIIKALLLGQKDDISKETYNNYASAGVVHILAVSGLHVGIILMILQFLLTPLFRFKHGDVYKSIIIFFLLWCFAFLAGLSPSVMRAVTMFSFVAFAINWKRRTSTINTLFLSAFVLLLLNPNMIFQVGFQLSYLAVFSIVLLQPILFDIIPRPRYRIPRLLWGVFTVTIAAQVGVFPLSLFYFHQFPGLFFLTNVLIIPFLGLILGYGILCITLALIGMLPAFLVEGFSSIIKLMNGLINWVAQQESFLFRDIHFSAIQTVATYILIATILLSLRHFNTRKFIYILLAAILCQLGFLYEKYTIKNEKEWIVFQQTAQTALGFREGSLIVLATQDSIDEVNYLNTILTNYKVGSGVTTIDNIQLKDAYRIFEKKLFIVDSLGAFDASFENGIVLLRNSPKINLTRFIDSVKPAYIIADGSNYKSYVARWKKTCIIKKLPFHHTGEKGAFLIKN